MVKFLYLLFWGLFSLSAWAQTPVTITLATTTSTDNSGLIDYLLPKFTSKYNIIVKVIATGTGKALKLAEKGDVDIVLVHAPAKELMFVASGFGVKRQSLMHNNFIIVGSINDPAQLSNSITVDEAFNKIAINKTIFISRGDESGTHTKEQQIWQQAKIDPHGKWYLETGQGMSKTLQIADELNAYTLVDAGTWLKLKSKTKLKLAFGGDEILFNQYSVILVSPKKHPHIKYRDADIFAQWLTSKTTKKLINNYKIAGQQLFFADDN